MRSVLVGGGGGGGGVVEGGEGLCLVGVGLERLLVLLDRGQGGREGRSLDEDKCDGGSQETRPCEIQSCPRITSSLGNG